MNRVSRAERLMEKLVDKDLLTEGGKNFLIATVDPFHDNPVDFQGIPDGQSSQNITQTIKQTINIPTPPSVTTGNFDCYIVCNPWVNNPYLCSVNNFDGTSTMSVQSDLLYQWASVSNWNIPGLMVMCAPSQEFNDGTLNSNMTSFLAAQAKTFSPNVTFAGLSLNDQFRLDKRRVCGVAFEVYNTTAQLYKGGSCVVWRSPVPDLEESQEALVTKFTNTTDATIVAKDIATQVIQFEGPPSSVGNAMLLPNSKQWDAEKGCYVVVAMHGDSERNPLYRDWIQPLITTTTSSGIPVPSLVGGALLDTTKQGATLQYYNDIEWHHGDLCGAYFTGLAAGSQLTINYNIILERFPGLDDINLSVLSKPSPLQDDNALELYSRIVRDLPVGVPVDQNGFGDWFAGIVNTAKEYIAPVLSMIPHPAAQGASKLIEGASSIINRNSASEQLNARSKVERRQRKRRGKAQM